MPRPKKIKSPEDFGKEFEKLKKPRRPKELMNKKEFAEKIEELNADRAVANIVCHDTNVPAPLEELRELEKKLRACTDETPRDIRYATFSGEEFDLHIEYNNITIIASMKDECSKFFAGRKCFNIECKKSYLATAHKMLEVLKEWRDEQ